MTVTISNELEAAVRRKAEQRHIPVEHMIREALQWYLQIDADLVDELTAWQEVRDEAALVVEGSPS